ncbi:MAG: nucleotidyltransferase [Planctomycetes bacterium]|nr:nucleotidyltransferase [Planctomycetota bacterium]MBM4082794.1 nucleotidyltransferase [Planctomycetota bacterium]
MNTKADILRQLQSLKAEAQAKYKVKGLELFGSVVRGEQNEQSDIDVLADFADDADLLDFVGLGLFLEERLNMKVDVVPRPALREELRDAVLKEAVPV